MKTKHNRRDSTNGQYSSHPTHADDLFIPCKKHGKTGAHGCEGLVPKFTPSEWIIKPSDNALRRMTGAKTPEEMKTNAQLISAAPELLEALELILEYTFNRIDPSDLIPTMARRAINKARGES